MGYDAGINHPGAAPAPWPSRPKCEGARKQMASLSPRVCLRSPRCGRRKECTSNDVFMPSRIAVSKADSVMKSRMGEGQRATPSVHPHCCQLPLPGWRSPPSSLHQGGITFAPPGKDLSRRRQQNDVLAACSWLPVKLHFR